MAKNIPPFNHHFLLRLYDSANILRWNDQVRVVDFRELDKQAHKLVIAYVIAKHHETDRGFDWTKIIEGGIFEFLQRLVITDLKPQLIARVKKDPPTYRKLLQHTTDDLRQYFTDQSYIRQYLAYFETRTKKPDINHRILDAAHFYATREEFRLIKGIIHEGYRLKEVHAEIEAQLKRVSSLKGLRAIERSKKLKTFIGLCGQLRFQVRWSQIQRVPRTSVLGHMLLVAILGNFFLKPLSPTSRRCYLNFFTALFHDLPEALTRDIINPVKQVEGMKVLVTKYEHEEMKAVYALLPKRIADEMRIFTANEFADHFEQKRLVRDGTFLKMMDELAAYLETYLALKHGSFNPHMRLAKDALYRKYHTSAYHGIPLGRYYQTLERDFSRSSTA